MLNGRSYRKRGGAALAPLAVTVCHLHLRKAPVEKVGTWMDQQSEALRSDIIVVACWCPLNNVP